MGNLPISGLPNLTGATNNSLIPIVASGVTYNIDILDLWKSSQPFGTMYQDWIPDAPNAYAIGSVENPLKDIFVSTGSIYIGPTKLTAPLTNVMTSNVGFAAPLVQIGNVNASGNVITTSGYSITDQNRELIAVKNSTGEFFSITQQTVQTGGTVNQVLTMTANTSYGFGWVTPTQYVSTGGTVNQVLTKTGGTSSSFGWVTLPQANWTATTGQTQILNVTGPNGPTNVSIGKNTGQFTPPSYGVAIGNNAGESSQGEYGVAIGNGAGQLFQGTNAVAIGSAGYEDQGQYAVAIGSGAGDSGQGAYAIAIGAGAGANNQTAGSIIIDATNTVQSAAGAGLHIAPIRTGATSNNLLSYNTTSKEITYNTLTPAQIPTRYYGAFSSTVSQVASAANAINIMSANTTEHSYGVTLSANTRFVMLNTGVYNIQFSAQLQQQQNVNSDISIWFRKNGVNITNSNTEIAIEKNGAGNSKLVAAWNYVDTFNANDYFEIAWSSPDGTMEILYEAPKIGPVRPATPSLIVTVTQV